MKNKLILTLLTVIGFAASFKAEATTFVDVKSLADGVTVLTGGGTNRVVNAALITKNQRWTRDRVYILSANVIVQSDVTLVIEPGTLIRAERESLKVDTGGEAAANPADPGALVCARGGKIIANGTADAPIIFTSIDDPHVPGGYETIPPIENKGVVAGATIKNVQRTLRTGGSSTGTIGEGTYTYSGGTIHPDAFDYDLAFGGSESIHTLDGLWGGIVLCGKATVSKGYSTADTNARGTNTLITEPTVNTTTGAISNAKGVEAVEGMAAFPTHAFGGGDDDLDNSGILRFVEVRYGGFIVINGKELNSFSSYGVGQNTVMEFLADWNNADDSFEFWGGSVGMRWAMSCFPGDDGLDTDQGYLGANQFFVQFQNNGINASGTKSTRGTGVNIGDNVTENDGSESSNTTRPYSVYTLANATLVGRGYNDVAVNAVEPQCGPNYKDNGSVQMHNSIIMDSPNGAILVMDTQDTSVTTASEAGGSAINRFATNRATGGFDGAGKASDLTTADTGVAANPDGLYKNVWFYRCGLLGRSQAGVNGKYATLALFNEARTSNSVAAYTASDSNLFPTATDRKERGTSANNVTNRANISLVIDQLKATNNYNKFNVSPGLDIPYNHRISGIDLRVTGDAKDLTTSALPTYRNINADATFVGAVRDNMWMRGWTMADKAGLFIAEAKQIVPEVVVSVNVSNQPVITFGGEVGKKYMVEVSTDNRTFTKIRTVTAVNGNNDVTDAARTVGSGLLLYRVICL
jgi:hypothetical protein